MENKIPEKIKEILVKIEAAGFEAYIVGGSVRNLLMGREVKDWDLTTNAKPEEIMQLFPDSFYENEFGTVGVKTEKLFSAITEDISINKEAKGQAIKIAKKYLEKVKCPIHGIEHAENVIKNIHAIAERYKNVNMDILELAGYFHDTGRHKFEDYRHDLESKEIVQKELKKFFDKNIVNLLVQIIEHDKDEESSSLEQEILKEADLLDGIGEWRIKKSLKENTSHIEWIKNSYQNLIYKIYLERAFEKITEQVKIVNKILNIKLLAPSNIPVDVVEITTYRIESNYSDKRHPDKIKFAETLEEDLQRRDFTINALALRINQKGFEIIDLFSGQKDLRNKIIRTVGNPDERFSEDALRMMRAIRFYSQLDFSIEEKTLKSIKKNSKDIEHIALERIKDELVKIILSDKPSEGIGMLHETNLLNFIIPELENGYGIAQNRHHIHTIYKHNLLSLKFCPSKKLEVRLAALLHDIAKPQTKRGEGEFATFYNHDHVGAKVAEKILRRLRFSNDIIDKVRLLIDNHMFYYNPDEVTESSVRKLIQKVGLENMQDLIDLRIADRLGSGTPKAKPYKLRHLEYIIDKVSRDAVSVKMLKINGHDLMQELGIKPGPKIGTILDVLLAEVIEDAKKNERKFLLTRAEELEKNDLEKLRKMAKIKIEEKKEEDDQEIKKKHWVK